MQGREATPDTERPSRPAVRSGAAEPTRVVAAVVDDGEIAAAGQLTRAAFLARVRGAVTSAVDEELAGTGRTSQDRPHLDRWLAHFGDRPASAINTSLRRFLGGTPRTADLAITAIAERARAGAAVWRQAGTLGVLASGLVPMDVLGGDDGSPQSKPDGAAATRGDPVAVRGRLGAGRPLEAGVRARMERGLGTSLGAVRVHDDAPSRGVASELSSRAVTVGQDIAFGAGQYQPGTPLGDALIAHELVHTVQQRGATERGTGGDRALEGEADHGAMAAMAHLWGERSPESVGVGRSGLQLSGCAAPPAAIAIGAAAGGGGAAVAGGGAAATGITLFGVTLTTTEAVVLTTAAVTTTTVLTYEATRDRTIDIAPPIPRVVPRTRPPKPLFWNPAVNVTAATSTGGDTGGLDFTAGAGSISLGGRSVDPGSSGAAWSWQAHHTWPMQYGGAPSQPLMGVRQALHQAVIHPLMLTYLQGLGHDVSPNTTDPRNVVFIARLRTDPVLRATVAAELEAFYVLLNTQTEPPMPPTAYSKGIAASLTALGP